MNGRCVTVLTTNEVAKNAYAVGITLDSKSLFVTSASDPHLVFSLPFAGGTPTGLVKPVPTPTIYGSGAVTVAKGTVYWTTGGGLQTFAVPTAGGALTTISSTENDPEAITTDGSRVYWTDQSRIRYLTVGSTTPNTLPITTDAGTPFQTPTGIAVDGTYVYWSNQGGAAGTAQIWRANKSDGSNATLLTMSAADSIQGITIDASTIYFTENYGGAGRTGVYSIPLAGGTSTTLSTAAAGDNYPLKMVSDATSIYWINGESVRRMTKGVPSSITTLFAYGGALQSLVSGGGTFNDLTVDSTYVYVTQSGAPFTVYRVAKN
jgi:hypothetical protein